MITVNELFSGIGSQSAALDRLEINFKVVGIAEIDKYAIKSYEAIHGQVRNYGDISVVEKLEYADFWTYSFPCQDISVAGKRRGINENTRSGLLYQVERLLEVSKQCGELPKYLMLENVKNLVGKQFKPRFDEWLQKLDELGFNTYWQVLNAKNYGIPQNRERVFAISIRKDIDMGYEFPLPFDNGKRLKDVLEAEVDEKFYINNEKTEKLISQLSKACTGIVSEQATKFNGETEYANTLLARDYKGFGNQGMNCVVETNNQKRLGGLYDGETKHQAGSVWDIKYIAPTVDTMQGGNRQPCVLIKQATKQGYIECNIPGVADLSFPDSKTRRGRVQDGGEICPTLLAGQQDLCYIETKSIKVLGNYSPSNHEASRIVDTNGISPTVKENHGTVTGIVELPCIAASRGRNIENPSDRTPGNEVEQRLEINKKGTSNTITTVQKDNYVVEPNTIIDDTQGFDGCRYYSENTPTLRSQRSGLKTIDTNFRIRKLTPLECWRLMGFTDEQFHKAAEVNSNSQLYKQAGNSIVVDVLYYLFKNLFASEDVEE